MNTTPTPVTVETFAATVLGSEKPVLVDFWADWCSPCHRLAPVLEQLAAEEAARFVVAKVNVDEQPELAELYDVKAFPTLALFSEGELVHRMIGAAPKRMILAEFADHL